MDSLNPEMITHGRQYRSVSLKLAVGQIQLLLHYMLISERKTNLHYDNLYIYIVQAYLHEYY